MCYGMGCPYEREGDGEYAGECTVNLNDSIYNGDAVCMQREEICENCKFSEYLSNHLETDNNQVIQLMICEQMGSDHYQHILTKDHPCEDCDLTEV